ncbi:hypothetical protein CRYUN_Cryun01aG0241800 [Craigia yunnanensis]
MCFRLLSRLLMAVKKNTSFFCLFPWNFKILRILNRNFIDLFSSVSVRPPLREKVIPYNLRVVVEDFFRRRHPLPSMDAIYFIQPSKENIVMFLSDMSGGEPLYKKAFVFFSSPVPKEFINHIKRDASVLPHIGALREMNLEYFPIDGQGFITDHETALEELFSEDADKSRKFEVCLNTMATRIATVFTSLKELPFVRYRAVKAQDTYTVSTRDLIPSKLAEAAWNCLLKYKSIPNFPQTKTCELLILDRSVDQIKYNFSWHDFLFLSHIAPVIHEWTYDVMHHDLLDMVENKYMLEVPNKSGGPLEKKEVVLEDHDPVWLELRHAHRHSRYHDPVWLELRHAHIADASERLHDKMTNNQGTKLHRFRGQG